MQSLFGSEAIPAHGLNLVLGNTLPVGIAEPETILRLSVSLFGSAAIPAHGLDQALGNTIAVTIAITHLSLSPGIALAGGVV